MKEIVILGGPNGAGKTTAARVMLSKFIHVHAFLNAYEIARTFPKEPPETVLFKVRASGWNLPAPVSHMRVLGCGAKKRGENSKGGTTMSMTSNDLHRAIHLALAEVSRKLASGELDGTGRYYTDAELAAGAATGTKPLGELQVADARSSKVHSTTQTG
jgi:ABC-type branched-subunit amino acid transport system ATPase component